MPVVIGEIVAIIIIQLISVFFDNIVYRNHKPKKDINNNFKKIDTNLTRNYFTNKQTTKKLSVNSIPTHNRQVRLKQKWWMSAIRPMRKDSSTESVSGCFNARPLSRVVSSYHVV